MDIDIKKNLSDSESENLEFTVMPKHQPDPETQQISQPTNTRLNQYLKWVIIGLIVVILGIVVGIVYQRVIVKQEATSPEPVNIVLPDNEPVDQDSDNDGLTDLEEERLGTNPQKADSDGDGLSDGDENFVYLTNPLLVDTDNDGFDDGREVARGFSPLVKSADFAGAEEIGRWRANIVQYGLHEPTPTTLILKANNGNATPSTYINTAYNYAINIPPILAVRESLDKNSAGIYVSGRQPVDQDFNTDPIHLALAINATGSGLQEWLDSLYTKGLDYLTDEAVDTPTTSGIRLRGMPGEFCNSDKTFFSKGNTVIIITLSCSTDSGFEDLYTKIIKTFSFQQ